MKIIVSCTPWTSLRPSVISAACFKDSRGRALALWAKEETLLDYWQGAAGWGREWKWSGYRALAFTAAAGGRGVTVDLQGDSRDGVCGGAPAAPHIWMNHDSYPSDATSPTLLLSFSATPWTQQQKYSSLYSLDKNSRSCWCWKHEAQLLDFSSLTWASRSCLHAAYDLLYALGKTYSQASSERETFVPPSRNYTVPNIPNHRCLSI